MNTNRSEHQVVSDILKELQAVVKREGRRHMMDQHLTFSLLELLEEEIIPMLENELDFDPPHNICTITMVVKLLSPVESATMLP
jgi:hypothetical protein